MAIALEQTNSNSVNNPGTSHTLTHTVGAGSLRYLLLLVMWEDDNNETLTPVWDAAGADQALTRIGTGYVTSDDAQTSAYGLVSPDVGTDKLITIGISPTLGAGGLGCTAFSLTGVDPDTPVRDEAGQSGGDFSVGTAALTGLTAGDWIAGGGSNENLFTAHWNASTITMTETLDAQQGASTLTSAYGVADSATEDIVVTYTGSDHAAMGAWAFIPGVGGAIDQEGFRWRDDDADEDEAAWLENQDVDASVAQETNVRLRVLLNATDDPSTAQFQLEYKETGDASTEYRKIELT